MFLRNSRISQYAAAFGCAALATTAAASQSSFNPRISAILDGAYYSDNLRGEAFDVIEETAGFGGGHHDNDEHGHESGHGFDQGFNLREVEISLQATVDPYLDAFTVFTLDSGGGVELEEAYATTRALPAGLQLKFGKFLSDIGYINRQHPHEWHFTDRPLVNHLLFGDHGLQDIGVQLSWLAPTTNFLQLGLEVLQGDGEVFANYQGGETLEGFDDNERVLPERSGPRLVTTFARWSPDLGADHTTRIGVSGGFVSQFHEVEEHGSRFVDADGDGWFAGIDWVHKFDGGGFHGHRNWQLQAEYYYRVKDFDLRVTPIDAATHPAQALDGAYRNKQDGVYLQGVYGIAPRWQIGARYDGVGFTNRVSEHSPGASHRYTGMLSLAPTEFSRLRLQYAYGDILAAEIENIVEIEATEREYFHQFFLQFIIGLGAHSAHAF